eukprot:TRINITY_DN4491_c0_g1_i5.p1 TRINITY_DN4491_c0_g1~~TRINITY_DN4491_c0_g1_i5.p1  ORF type:complete len:1843 (+),score=145.32 TRINITY_DN4491_c0_g1_i5:476-5530(+)
MIAGKEQCQLDGSFKECVPVGGVDAPVVEDLSPSLQPISPALSPAASPTVVPFRVTIDGQPCVFPFTYRQQSYNDCLIVAGREQCQINGSFEECAPLGGGLATTTSEVPPTQSQPVSPSPSPSPPAASSSPVQRVTVDGEPCVFPFTYRQQSYNDCLIVAGKEQCQINGSFKECAQQGDGTTPATPAPVLSPPLQESSPISSPTLTPTSSVSPSPLQQESTQPASVQRVTVDGEPCNFPFTYRQQRYYDCLVVAGIQQCQINGQFKECAPVEGGPTLGSLQAPSLTPATSPSSSPTPNTPTTLSRVTVDGEPCVFPFTFGENTYNDCTNAGGREVCLIGSDFKQCAPAAAGPTGESTVAVGRTTVGGDDCQLPYIYRGQTFYDCTNIAGKDQCLIDGKWQECTPLDSTVTQASSPTQEGTPLVRTTIIGQICTFPNIFQGNVYNDCFMVGQQESCEVNGILYECVPLEQPSEVSAPASPGSPTPPALSSSSASPVPSAGRTTVDGTSCELPFIYRGQTFYDCTTIAGKEQCRLNDQWQECAPLDTQAASNTTASPVERLTTLGQLCTFPNVYQGEVYNDCFMVGSQESCEVNGILYGCVPVDAQPISQSVPSTELNPQSPTLPAIVSPVPSPTSGRVTLDGDSCISPFTIGSQTYTDCAPSGDGEICLVGDFNFKQCAPIAPASPEVSEEFVNRTTIDGVPCEIPYTYRGIVFYDCTTIAGRDQCRLNNQWQDCAPLDISEVSMSSPQTNSPVERMTILGQLCTFPNVYQGKMYNDCFMVGQQKSCEVNGILYECIPMDSPAVVPNDTSASAEVDNLITQETGGVTRVTVSGANCELPYVYRGQTFFDCTIIAGKEQCRLNNQWQDCAPLNSSSTTTSSSSSSSPVVRTTSIGQLCTFPNVYQGQVYDDCFMVNSQESCEVNGILYQCVPEESLVSVSVPSASPSNLNTSSGISLRVTITGQPCDYTFDVGIRTYTDECATSGGREVCRSGGELLECQPLAVDSPITPSPEVVAPSPQLPAGDVFTVDGQKCIFPFNYRGQDYYNCFVVGGQNSCRINNQWYECSSTAVASDGNTVRTTVDGQQCQIPFTFDGEIFNDCRSIQGVEYCYLNEQWEVCAPATPSAAPVQSAATRITVDGQQCVLPFTFQGDTYIDCLSVQGTDYCLIDNLWEECAPLGAGIPVDGRFTIDGRQCQLPFTFQNTTYEDCTTIQGKQYCYLDDLWEECQSVVAEVGQSATERVSITGAPCMFPNYYRGNVYNDCFVVEEQEVCEINGIINVCRPLNSPLDSVSSPSPSPTSRQLGSIISPPPAVRVTTLDQKCDDSYEYEGTTHSGCIYISGSEYCKVQDVLFQCKPLEAGTTSISSSPSGDLSLISTSSSDRDISEVLPGNADDSLCSFPFYYQGNKYEACQDLNNDGIEDCVLNNKQVVECQTGQPSPIQRISPPTGNISTVTASRFAVDGSECVFPFNYRGRKYDNCTLINSVDSCIIGEIPKECLPPGEQFVLKSSGTEQPQCNFPFTYQNKTYNECTKDYDGQLKCLVQEIWYPCRTDDAATDNGNGSSQLSGGEIAAIVVSIVIVLALVVVGVIGYVTYKRGGLFGFGQSGDDNPPLSTSHNGPSDGEIDGEEPVVIYKPPEVVQPLPPKSPLAPVHKQNGVKDNGKSQDLEAQSEQSPQPQVPETPKLFL